MYVWTAFGPLTSKRRKFHQENIQFFSWIFSRVQEILSTSDKCYVYTPKIIWIVTHACAVLLEIWGQAHHGHTIFIILRNFIGSVALLKIHQNIRIFVFCRRLISQCRCHQKQTYTLLSLQDLSCSATPQKDMSLNLYLENLHKKNTVFSIFIGLPKNEFFFKKWFWSHWTKMYLSNIFSKNTSDFIRLFFKKSSGEPRAYCLRMEFVK